MQSAIEIPFGKTSDGAETTAYTLANRNGVQAVVTTFGATLVSLKVPDRNGEFANIVFGFDSTAQYEQKLNPHFGGTIGRYANRIAAGKFHIDDKQFQLSANSKGNTLHGGFEGFDRRLWSAQSEVTSAGASIKFERLSPDGEEGFPGNLAVSVTYALNDDNVLTINYRAHCDQPTVVNLTNHSYFNLTGPGKTDVLAQLLRICADQYVEVDDALIPTGKVLPVVGTPLDFREMHPIGQHIRELPCGYDHTFVLNNNNKGSGHRELILAAQAYDPASGRAMDVYTTEPGIQLYTCNTFDDSIAFADGRTQPYCGFCLETQHFPDSPNRKHFPDTTLRPDNQFESTTTYAFHTRQ